MTGPRRSGPAGRFAQAWIESKLTPLIITASLLIGAFAVWKLPREEEPQIIVPMIDVVVQMPGASAHEVEERVTKPMEKLLWEIPGVEYIYSTSSPGHVPGDRPIPGGPGRTEEHCAAKPVAGTGVILFDPIFQGLAIALMAGEVASLALSRMTVPIVYFVVNRRRKVACPSNVTYDSSPVSL